VQRTPLLYPMPYARRSAGCAQVLGISSAELPAPMVHHVARFMFCFYVDHHADSASRRLQEVRPDVRQEVDRLLRRLGGDGTPVVCVDMGSTPRMGLLPSPPRFVAVLDRALEAAGCGGLVVTGGYGPLAGEHLIPGMSSLNDLSTESTRCGAASLLIV